jgi:Holliday junction resolvase RusA-like endonuclease
MKIHFAINPGDLAVNGRHVPQYDRHGKSTGRIISSRTYRAALEEAILIVRQERIRHMWHTTKRQCSVSIITHWPTGHGDRDSTCKAICDALQHGGLVVNDKQCGPITLDATWRAVEPGVDVEIVEMLE